MAASFSQTSRISYFKLSTSFRHLLCLRHHSTATSTTYLAGKLPFFLTEKPAKLAENAVNVKLNNEVVNLPGLSHQQFAAVGKGKGGHRKVDSDADDDDDDDDYDVADYDDDFDDFDDDYDYDKDYKTDE